MIQFSLTKNKISKPTYLVNNNMSKIIVLISISILFIDTIYKTLNNITIINRQDCIFYNYIPRLFFLFYEYFIELAFVVIAGTFEGVLISKYFASFRKIMPKNQFVAFIYASIVPVCSCSVIPLIDALKNKIKTRVVFTFIVAAPILNPYIIILSFTTLGLKYGILRILCSLLLSVSIGLIMEKFLEKTTFKNQTKNFTCKPSGESCPLNQNNDVYQKTIQMVIKILPYLLFAGFLGILFEFYNPAKVLQHHYIENSWLSVLISVAVGIPLYLCNGADILFLYPLINFAKFSLGAAIAFSITSTAVCASSAVMLTPYIGRKATFVLITYIALFTIICGLTINYFFI